MSEAGGGTIRKRVAIIGGGIAGLTAAIEIDEQTRARKIPLEVVLFEASHRLGGVMLSEEEEGYIIEGGPDAFITTKPGVLRLVERLGLEEALLPSDERHKGSFVWSRGRLHPLPEGMLMMVPSRIGPLVTSTLFSWPGKLRMALDYFLPRRDSDEDETLEDFVVRRLGREALERLAEPLVAGIHAAEPSTMSIRATFPRFVEMEKQHGSLIKAALAARKRQAAVAQAASKTGSRAGARDTALAANNTGNPSPASDPASPAGPRRTFFMSFKQGMGQLAAGLAQSLKNVDVRLNTRVTEISRNGRYRLALAGRGGEAESYEADAVVLATPSQATARILRGLDNGLSELVGSIPQTSTATVTLVYRRADLPRPLEGHGFVVPSVEKRCIMGCTFISNKWPGRVPSDDVFMLRAFVGGPHNRSLVESGDREAVLTEVLSEMERMLGITADPLLSRVFLFRDTMHQYTLGHLDRVAAIRKREARFPGLRLAGGAYDGIGLPDCAESGRRAGEEVLAALTAEPAAR